MLIIDVIIMVIVFMRYTVKPIARQKAKGYTDPFRVGKASQYINLFSAHLAAFKYRGQW